MNEQVKQHAVKVLEFLKNHQDIDNLTLTQIQERLIKYEGLLIEFVEKVLKDKKDENGTMTTWWLYDNSPKKLWETTDTTLTAIDVQEAENFVNYMFKRNDKD